MKDRPHAAIHRTATSQPPDSRSQHRQDLRDRLLAKLDARERVQLVIIAYQAGLVTPTP